MVKCVYFVLVFIVLLGVASAADIAVEKIPKADVVVTELDNSAVFDFVITNNGSLDMVQIYSLSGVGIEPVGLFELSSGESIIEVKVRPYRTVREKIEGLFLFDYEIKGRTSGVFKDQALIKIVDLKDVIEIRGENINVGADEVEITIRNKEKTILESLDMGISSVFFYFEESISLGPLESASFIVPINTDKVKNLKYGPYVITADVNTSSGKTRVQGFVNYVESSDTSVERSVSGFLIKKTTIGKTNEGNTITRADIETSKNIVTRLFTVHSVEPTITSRAGLAINYRWEKDIGPGESFNVTTTTNYTFPVILLALIILIGVMSGAYTRTGVDVSKRVNYVRTKGGEFALKINLRVKAKKKAENIEIVDKIPAMAKLFEKFGRKPDRIDAKTRRIFWNIDKMSAGEERVFSYIMYSKLRVVGRFELPSATASYITGNKKEVAESNRVYFVSETTSTEDEE